MEGVNKLKTIWDNISLSNSGQENLSHRELIDKYMDLFHIGDYFYLIFNTKTAAVEYISPEVTTALGYDIEEINLAFILSKIHPDDLPYYYHYEQSAVRFFTNLPQDLLLKYKFAYDYRIQTKDGIYKRFQQQIVPIYYFPDGGVRTLGIFTDLTHLNVSGIPKLSFIGMKGAPSYYNIHLQKDFQLSTRLYTTRELEVLKYMVKGVKSEDIATALNLSVFTVRNHRKNILRKSNCENLQELLVQTIREGWV